MLWGSSPSLVTSITSPLETVRSLGSNAYSVMLTDPAPPPPAAASSVVVASVAAVSSSSSSPPQPVTKSAMAPRARSTVSRGRTPMQILLRGTVVRAIYSDSPAASRAFRLISGVSGVRFDLAHLDVLDRDRVRSQRGNPLSHRLGGVLGLEDDHRQSRVVLSCPVPGYEPWGLRHARYHPLAQIASRGFDVLEGDPNDDCVHRSPPLSLVSTVTLSAGGGSPMAGCVPWSTISTFSSDIARGVLRSAVSTLL